MAEPVTWLVLQALRDLVAGITVANGYRTDLGAGAIHTDRSHMKLEGSTPSTLIVAGEVADLPEASGRRTKASEMDITVEVAIPFELDQAELTAHRARADIVRAFSVDLRGQAEGFRQLELTGSRFDSAADEAGTPFTLVQVTARAGLAETATPAP